MASTVKRRTRRRRLENSRRAGFRRRGLCGYCGKKVAKSSRGGPSRFCKKHLEYFRAKAAETRRKAGMQPRLSGVPWRSHNYDRIVDYVIEYPGAPGIAIAADLGLNGKSIYVLLSRMADLGLISKSGPGWRAGGQEP